ncbi:TATA box-binding protein-associated factor RNA polymerase I subunit D [Sorex araneus]|uniref:TATA box-binding protein-associated factor RNA polymerase I subunit D n=1 Tax=Sorex araneus TaxID=42254 RepID=UPI002433FB2F|nr:TATA box-binding protein-associated factor RNA polymerase I subunit D [Sorex araneus]XP_054986077.1 TATA box-binding protein-associated factor RNA polymerase I subunit D [Sorex araneus]
MDSDNSITASGSDVEVENQSIGSSSGSSLFKTQCISPSTEQKQRNSVRNFAQSLRSAQIDSSSDSSIEPRPLSIRTYFQLLKQRKKRRKRRKYQPTGRPTGRPKGRRNRTSRIKRKEIKDKESGSGFPIVESANGGKSLPWRKILTFEQAVARGFFNYLEKLKYEYHLKESLKQMNVGEDLEKEDFDSRRYKYLDDDGSISPIEDAEAEDAAHLVQEDECDIKLVEKEHFIISSELSKKRNTCLEPEEWTETAVSKKRRQPERTEKQV